MDPMTKSVDKDARILGLALHHGYIQAADLEAAARKDPRPSAILSALCDSGVLDEPCLQGLEQSLEDWGCDPSLPPGTTSSTHTFPHFGPGPQGTGASPVGMTPRPRDSQGEDGTQNLIFRKLTIARWKHYLHLRFIGEGGMGRIFKAVDPDLNRTVALKFLRGQDPGQLRRFLFEAQAQALVEHPNICQVHEVSEWQGQHYIAMQYVNGPTLLKIRGELTSNQKLELMETVARAVHSAHCRGLIHRDLKPTNILVEKDQSGKLKPFVLDFGLARDTESRNLTVSGTIVGTTAYMAPEQARGEAHHIDRRTDIYSMGATLYELFAGCPPFGDSRGLDCLRLVVEQEPPPLRHRAREVPPDLETVVLKCMEKEPARRYDDALAFAEDLRRIREGDPILARPAKLGYRLSKFARKNRALVAVSGIAVAALLVLTGVAAYARISATARELAAQHFSQEAERIEAMLGYAHRLPVQNIQPHIERAKAKLLRLREEVRNSGRTASASGAYAVGRAYLAFGDFDQSLPELQRAEAGGLRTAELASALGRCYASIYQRELERARRLNIQGAQATQIRDARIRQVEQKWRDPTLLQLRQASARGRDPEDYLEALVEWYEERINGALAKVRSALARNPSFYEAKGLEGELLLALARQEKDRGSQDQAGALLDSASACFAEALKLAPSDKTLWVGEAKVNVERLRPPVLLQDSGKHLERCREAVRKCLEVEPNDPSPLSQVASALYWTGQEQYSRGQEAEGTLREGIALTQEVLGRLDSDYDAHFARIGLYNVLARCLRNTGKDPGPALEKAILAIREALHHHPQDWLLLSIGIFAAQTRMTWEGDTGRDFETTFQFAASMGEDLMRLDPTHPLSHLRMATLYVELGNIEIVRGKDPRPSTEKSQHYLEAAKKLNLDERVLLSTTGDTWLLRGQHNLALGLDPRSDLLRALASYEDRLKLPEVEIGSYGNVAEACFYLGLHDAQNGKDPSAWIARAQDALHRGIPLNEYYWLFQLQGQCEWLLATWATKHGQDADLHFEKSLKALHHAVALSRQPVPFRWLARIYRDRSKCLARGVEDLRSGLQAVHEALKRDPSSGEGNLLRGQLSLLRADRLSGMASTEKKNEGLLLIKKALELDGNLKSRVDRSLIASTRDCTIDL
jgi:eukaryotic-like serine/threonine-protein kinase